MKNTEKDNSMKEIFTIPNILTTVRISMIPFIMYFYLGLNNRILTAVFLVLSFLTDVADGYIARHYNQVSALGKALDPFADKLTQGAFMLCLMAKFPPMLYMLILIIVKEVSSCALGVIIARKSGVLKGADWHGKLTTGVMLLVFFVHFIWEEIPENVSNIMILVSCILMVISFILYLFRYARTIKEIKQGQKRPEEMNAE